MQGEKHPNLFPIGKIKYYSGKRLGKVTVINCFKNAANITVTISALEKNSNSRKFAPMCRYIFSIRQRKDGSKFFCFYKKTQGRGNGVRWSKPMVLAYEISMLYSSLNSKNGQDCCDQPTKKRIEWQNKMREVRGALAYPKIFNERLRVVLFKLLREHKIPTKYLSRNPFIAMTQLVWQSASYFTEEEIPKIEFNKYYTGDIAKNIFGSTGKRSKKLVKTIALSGYGNCTQKYFFSAIRAIRIKFGIDHAQTVAQALIDDSPGKNIVSFSKKVKIKFPGDREPTGFTINWNASQEFQPWEARMCSHYTYKEFVKMLFSPTQYRNDVLRDIHDLGIPAPAAHKTYEELHDFLSAVRRQERIQESMPIPVIPQQKEIQRIFKEIYRPTVECPPGIYLEFPTQTHQLLEYGDYFRNCVYGYASMCRELSYLVVVAKDCTGKLHSIFGFNLFGHPQQASRPVFMSEKNKNEPTKAIQYKPSMIIDYQQGSQRFNGIQNPMSFRSVQLGIQTAVSMAQKNLQAMYVLQQKKEHSEFQDGLQAKLIGMASNFGKVP